MPRFIVYETVQETVTYKHVIEDAADAADARRIVLEELTPDQGQWQESLTEGRTITDTQEAS